MDLPIDDENAPLYAVGQVAEMLGVQPAFLRRLDLERVVQPARSDGGQRRYSRAQIVQAHRVSEMAAEGMSLAGIRRILELEFEVAGLKRQIASEAAPQPHNRDRSSNNVEVNTGEEHRPNEHIVCHETTRSDPASAGTPATGAASATDARDGRRNSASRQSRDRHRAATRQ